MIGMKMIAFLWALVSLAAMLASAKRGGCQCNCDCRSKMRVFIARKPEIMPPAPEITEMPKTTPYPTGTTTTMFQCYLPFEEHAGSCYYLIKSTDSQSNQMDACAAQNGRLAHVSTPEEFDNLIDFIQGHEEDEAIMHWIQGMWIDNDGEFKDDDGEILFDGFAEDGIVMQFGNGEDVCVVMYETCARIVAWESCGTTLPAICERGPGLDD